MVFILFYSCDVYFTQLSILEIFDMSICLFLSVVLKSYNFLTSLYCVLKNEEGNVGVKELLRSKSTLMTTVLVCINGLAVSVINYSILYNIGKT